MARPRSNPGSHGAPIANVTELHRAWLELVDT